MVCLPLGVLCGVLVRLCFVVSNLPQLSMHTLIFSPLQFPCSLVFEETCPGASPAARGSQVSHSACLTCTNYPPLVPCSAVPRWLHLGPAILLACTEPQLPRVSRLLVHPLQLCWRRHLSGPASPRSPTGLVTYRDHGLLDQA